MFCSNCGSRIDDTSKFCPNCGYKFVDLVRSSAPQPNVASAQPSAASSQVSLASAQPSAASPQVSLASAQPGAVTAQPGGAATQSGTIAPQPGDSSPQKAVTVSLKSSIGVEQNTVDNQLNDAGTASPQPSIPTAQAGATSPQPSVPTPQAGMASGQVTPQQNTPVSPYRVATPQNGQYPPPVRQNGSQFAPYAGNPSQMGSVTTNTPKKSGAGKTVLIIIASVVATLLLVVGGLFVISSLSDSNEKSSSSKSDSKSNDGKDSEPIGKSDDEALNQVMAAITEAETLKAEFYDTYESTDDSTFEGMESIVNKLEELTGELDRIKEEADKISGLDRKAKNVETEYFNIMCNSHKSFYEMYAFQFEYLKFYNEYIANRPDIGNDEYYDDYYYRLADWYESTVEAYNAVSYPECVQHRWDKLGEVLDINLSILEKLEYACNNEDWLRIYSAEYMAERYRATENAWYDMSYDICEGEGTLAFMQSETATQLAGEYSEYITMSQKEREAYEFENISDGKVFVNFDAVDTIYPSLFNTYDSFLVVKSGCINGKRDIVVEAEIEGFTQKYKESFTLDSAYKVLEIKPPALTSGINLDTARDAQMTVTISDKNGDLIETKSFPVHITTRNDFQWFSDEFGVCTQDNILCFLTPESKDISELKRKSIDILSNISGGGIDGIVGYQYDDILATYLQAAALQIAMSEHGVRYNMDAFSSDGAHQHILLPNQVLQEKSGLCIETTLVIASALQSAGFHVYIYLPPGHAQVAVEINEDAGEYYLIETTWLPNSWSDYRAYYSLLSNGQYDNDNYNAPIIYMSADEWASELEQGETYLIDCNDGPILGLTPFIN